MYTNLEFDKHLFKAISKSCFNTTFLDYIPKNTSLQLLPKINIGSSGNP